MDRMEKPGLSGCFFPVNAGCCQRDDHRSGRNRFQQSGITYQCMLSYPGFLGSVAVGLQKFSLRAFAGVLMCFSGILFIFWDGIQDLANPGYRMGMIFLFCAISGWASGTIFTKKLNIQSGNITLNLFYQFLFAGIVQIGFAFIFSENYNFGNWTLKSISAMLYLAVFGSVAAFFAFHYALTKISPVQVSILAYINTIIAIFLGWLIMDEQISFKFIIAAALIICGVFIINYKPGMFRKAKTESLKANT